MLIAGFSRLQLFVGFTGACSVLLALWMAFVVLHRHRLERVAVILAAVAAILTAYLYVSLWGFTIVL